MNDYTVTWQFGPLRGTFEVKAADFWSAVDEVRSDSGLPAGADVIGIKATSRRAKASTK